MIQNLEIGTAAPSTTSGDASARQGADLKRWTVLALVALAAVALIGYLPAVTAPLLLDEQFLADWTGGLSQQMHAGGPANVLAFPGLDPVDSWGPLTPLTLMAGQALSAGAALPQRLAGIALHWLAASLLFLIVQVLYPQRFPLVALSAALLFTVYPLSPEAATWLGGRSCLLAVVSFLAAFLCYLRGTGASLPDRRPDSGPPARSSGDWGKASRRSYIGALTLYIISLCSARYMWSAALVIVLFEVARRLMPATTERPALKHQVLSLAPFLVASLVCLSAGALTQPQPVSPQSLAVVLKNMVWPINQVIWHGYAREYRFLYFALAPALAILPLVLWRGAPLRFLAVFSMSWAAIAIAPFAGAAVQDSGLYGSRWLYLASAPLCILLSVVYAGAPELIAAQGATAGLPGVARRCLVPLARTAGVIFVASLCVFYFRHLYNQNAAYRVGGKVLASIQESMRMVVDKEKAPFLIARDIPEYVHVAPAFSTAGAPVFDGQTLLLAAPSVPGGRLKDLLRQGLLQATTVRWDHNFRSLVPLDLSPRNNEYGAVVEGTDLRDRLRPPLAYLQGTWFDLKEGAIVTERNSGHGPVLSFRGEGLSPLAGDFLFIDARVNTPGRPLKPCAELHWLTVLHDDYDTHERKALLPITVNDGQYHRYFFPLRTVAWTTNGPINQIALGFPAGAKVWLKSLGVTSGQGRVPALLFKGGKQQTSASLPSDSPYFAFPLETRLGLAPVRSERIELVYALDAIPGARSGLIEISRKGERFANPCGNELSDSALTRLPLRFLSGTFVINAGQFPGPGPYSIRLIGVDENGNPVGNFSDDLSIVVGQR